MSGNQRRQRIVIRFKLWGVSMFIALGVEEKSGKEIEQSNQQGRRRTKKKWYIGGQGEKVF